MRPAFQISLIWLLYLAALLPVGVGFISAVDLLAYLAAYVYLGFRPVVSGWPFFLDVRLGIAVHAACGWVVLCIVAFTLGSIRSRSVHVISWIVPVSMVLLPLVQGMLGGVSFFSVNNPWRDVAVGGALLVSICWLAGWWLRGRQLATEATLKSSRARLALLAVTVVSTLCLSACGWLIIHDYEDYGFVPSSEELVFAAAILFAIVFPSIPCTLYARDLVAWLRRRSEGCPAK